MTPALRQGLVAYVKDDELAAGSCLSAMYVNKVAH